MSTQILSRIIPADKIFLDMKNPTEITFETEDTIVLREGSRVCVEYCSGCGKEALMASPQAAGLLAGAGEREIFRLLEAGFLHFSERVRVLICLESLSLMTKDPEASKSIKEIVNNRHEKQ